MPLNDDSKGIPDGALTVLVIAAVAVVSVAVTLLCMLISHRRTLRRRQQQQTATAATVAATISRPNSMPTASPLPLYIQQAFDPKFDSPPTYEEAVRSPPLSPVATSPVALASPLPAAPSTSAESSSLPPPTDTTTLQIPPSFSHPPLPDPVPQAATTFIAIDTNRPSTSRMEDL